MNKLPKKVETLTIVLVMAVMMFDGYVLGRATLPKCLPSVLGVQSPKTLSSLVAALIKISPESRTVNPGLNVSPDTESAQPVFVPVSTETPQPEPIATETPSIIWSGLHRTPDPTEVPKPTTEYVSPTPVENIDDDNIKTKPSPTPTSPEYRYGGTGRGGNTPTPTPFEKPIEESMGNNDRNSGDYSNDPRFHPTPSAAPAKNKFTAGQIGDIIDTVGINIEKPQISRNTENDGYKISGTLRDQLFGVFVIPYPVEIVVNETSGQIENVSIPWWRTLFGNPFVGKVARVRCGDGVCSPTESFDTCKEDCPFVCGNGICEYGEGQDTCPADCSIGQ